jgi:hypothetical protein
MKKLSTTGYADTTPFEQSSGVARRARPPRSSVNVTAAADSNCPIFTNETAPTLVDGRGYARLIRHLIFWCQQMAAMSESASLAAAP